MHASFRGRRDKQRRSTVLRKRRRGAEIWTGRTRSECGLNAGKRVQTTGPQTTGASKLMYRLERGGVGCRLEAKIEGKGVHRRKELGEGRGRGGCEDS
jgi:hypothetical protein